MIEVKSTKPSAPEADASSIYVLESTDRKTATPHVFGLLLAGLAVYLKSIFPSKSDTATADPMPAGEDTAGQVLEAIGAANGIASPAPVASDEPAPEQPGHAPPVGKPKDTREFDRPKPIDSFDVAGFALPESAIGWRKPIPSPLAGGPANDNSTVGQFASGNFQPSGEPRAPEEKSAPDEDEDPDPDGPEEAHNRAPKVSGPVYLRDVTECAVLTIAVGDLLANAHDPDGDVLSVKNITVSSGELTHLAGTWTFEAGPQMTGPVTISYQITDGQFSVHQTAHFSVVRSFIQGTGGDDILLGTTCPDDIDGDGGHDNIDARAGDDVISGGAGDDHIVAGDGNDVVFGGEGNDVVFGGEGNDTISGGSGNDRLFAGAGDDVVFSEAGDDVAMGGNGDDFVSGGAGADVLHGEADDDTLDGGGGDDFVRGDDGNDMIDGGDGADRIDGGGGNDVLLDGAGEDTASGGTGDDRVVAAADSANDSYDGGQGTDTLDYSTVTTALFIDVDSGVALGVEIGEDSITGFEHVAGGSGNDLFTVGMSPVTLQGGGGEDTFEFMARSTPEPAAAGLEMSGPATEGSVGPAASEIVDFRPGDLIRMSKWDIFEAIVDNVEDQFEEIYGKDTAWDEFPIRVRHDWLDEMDFTIIEADINNDDTYETAVTIDGHRALVIIEHA